MDPADYQRKSGSHFPWNRKDDRDRYRDKESSRDRDKSPMRSRYSHFPTRLYPESRDAHPPSLGGRARVQPVGRPLPEIKRMANLEKEQEEFDAVSEFSHNFEPDDYKRTILKLKNFVVAEKYYQDMLSNKIKPSAEIYRRLISLAIQEEKYDEAEKLFQAGRDNLSPHVFDDLLEEAVNTRSYTRACKIVKFCGADAIPKLLNFFEQSQVIPPPHVFVKLMQACRHKGDRPANIAVAEQILAYVEKNHIPVFNIFYIKLCDIYCERGNAKAWEIFDKHIPYEVGTVKERHSIDLHGLTPRVGLLVIEDFIRRKLKRNDYLSFYVITGHGVHNQKGEKGVLRDFIQYNLPNVSKDWHSQIPEDNPGILFLHYDAKNQG